MSLKVAFLCVLEVNKSVALFTRYLVSTYRTFCKELKNSNSFLSIRGVYTRLAPKERRADDVA
jgi:hypothetical protein